MAFFVYILHCADDSLYTGYTTNLEKRLKSHNDGTGAKYTKGRRPVTMVYHEELPTKSAALKREWAIKKLPREQKLRLFK